MDNTARTTASSAGEERLKVQVMGKMSKKARRKASLKKMVQAAC